MRDLGELLERFFGNGRFALLSVGENVDTATASGRMVLNILATIAQWERETIGERTAEALGHLKAQGVRLGGEALGWTRKQERDFANRRVIVAVAKEAATVARIIELRNRGASLRGIAAMLKLEGHRTKLGGRWYASTVHAVLRANDALDLPPVAPRRAG